MFVSLEFHRGQTKRSIRPAPCFQQTLLIYWNIFISSLEEALPWKLRVPFSYRGQLPLTTDQAFLRFVECPFIHLSELAATTASCGSGFQRLTKELLPYVSPGSTACLFHCGGHKFQSYKITIINHHLTLAFICADSLLVGWDEDTDLANTSVWW